MSRIEKTEEPPKTSSQMKDEVVERYGDQKKNTHGRFSCSMIVLACLVLFFCFLAWQVAATGLVTLPVFTSLAFENPKPVRVIQAGTPIEQLSESIFRTTLTKRLRASGGVLTDRSIALALPESSLTATLQNELKKTGETNVDATGAQIAVLPNQELELFIPVKTGDHTTDLLMHVSLIADQGLFDLKLLDVRLGSFHAPSVLVASLVQPFVNRELASLNQSLSSYMHVDALTTQDGVLNASGTFTVELKK
ncbi:MAG: hypothetical protein NTX72_02265 [Candidatus Uhrbacteria bacterium]|nr:hypothetical protein [Candidatus Uhrbacteria bacterium]